MAKIAKKAGLSRENLYRSLNGETKAELETGGARLVGAWRAVDSARGFVGVKRRWALP